MTRLNVLDLFSGLHGWAEPFIDRGHRVVTTDIDPIFDCTITGDFLDPKVRETLMMFGPFDIVLASPPCEAFSVASIGTHWGGGKGAYVPKTERAELGIALLDATVEFCQSADTLFVIENPRGVMRKMESVQSLDRRTVTYCQYGQRNMKPTDLFSNAFHLWEPRPPCKNGDSCHDAAPRGAKTGTQGIKGYALRSKIPYELALDVCLAVESACGCDACRRRKQPWARVCA
jgi:hypothetical protein